MKKKINKKNKVNMVPTHVELKSSMQERDNRQVNKPTKI